MFFPLVPRLRLATHWLAGSACFLVGHTAFASLPGGAWRAASSQAEPGNEDTNRHPPFQQDVTTCFFPTIALRFWNLNALVVFQHFDVGKQLPHAGGQMRRFNVGQFVLTFFSESIFLVCL